MPNYLAPVVHENGDVRGGSDQPRGPPGFRCVTPKIRAFGCPHKRQQIVIRAPYDLLVTRARPGVARVSGVAKTIAARCARMTLAGSLGYESFGTVRKALELDRRRCGLNDEKGQTEKRENKQDRSHACSSLSARDIQTRLGFSRTDRSDLSAHFAALRSFQAQAPRVPVVPPGV